MNSFGRNTNMPLDMGNIPQHVAIIMDGNGRWAKKCVLPKKAGHKAGAQALEKISTEAMKLGIKHLTVYAFSTENWKRSKEEVDGIMDLLRNYLKTYIDRAKTDNVKVDVIGNIFGLDLDIQEQIIKLEGLTKNKTGLSLHIALNYGSRDEIVRAVKKIGEKISNGQMSVDDIDEDCLSNSLDTAGYPDPDLLIRTSGEERVSNFLLWQIAYSEFVFSDKLWPDYTPDEFRKDLYYYQTRDRRFGGR